MANEVEVEGWPTTGFLSGRWPFILGLVLSQSSVFLVIGGGGGGGGVAHGAKYHSISDVTPSFTSNTSRIICQFGLWSRVKKGNARTLYFILPYKGV